jgi:hypothetical protein
MHIIIILKCTSLKVLTSKFSSRFRCANFVTGLAKMLDLAYTHEPPVLLFCLQYLLTKKKFRKL